MAERAAHLVDDVFPDVPVRQWGLSLPYRLRYHLAWDHDLCRGVVAVSVGAVLGWLRRRAQGDGVADGRGGAVAVIQRFGGALNLNVHVHALVLDGVFAKDDGGTLVCHPAARLTALDVAEVLATVEPRIRRLLDRRGLGDDDGGTPEDPWADASPVLAGLAAASVQRIVGTGPRRGARVRRVGGRRPRPCRPRRPGGATRARMASTCMPAWWYPLDTATDSSASVAIPFVPRCQGTGSGREIQQGRRPAPVARHTSGAPARRPQLRPPPSGAGVDARRLVGPAHAVGNLHRKRRRPRRAWRRDGGGQAEMTEDPVDSSGLLNERDTPQAPATARTGQYVSKGESGCRRGGRLITSLPLTPRAPH